MARNQEHQTQTILPLMIEELTLVYSFIKAKGDPRGD